MKPDLLDTVSTIAIDGRPRMLPAEAARIAGMKEVQERQLHRAYPDLATAQQRTDSNKILPRHYWSEAFCYFVAARGTRLGLTWAVSLDISVRSLKGLANYALRGVVAEGAFHFGIRPHNDNDEWPLVIEIPPTVTAEAKLAADLCAAGVIAVVVPVRELLAEFCSRATAELNVEVWPERVLACYIAGSTKPDLAGSR